MLSVRLHAGDLNETWVPSPTGWSAGRSVIEPYQNPVLHCALFASLRRTAVIVRERICGYPIFSGGFTVALCSEAALDRELAEARTWPLDFHQLVITHGEISTVELTCGRWGTAPVFLLVRERTLHLDWNVNRLYPHLRSARLDPGFAAQYIYTLDHPYSRRTIFPRIGMLTERAVASWKTPWKETKIVYPPAERHSVAKALKPGARAANTFCEILSASMKRWLSAETKNVALELSGGLDSSVVAACAGRLAPGRVRSYGMIMPGSISRHQRARRNEIVRRFGLHDRTLPCIAHPPFNAQSPRVRNLAIVPWGEFYEEAVGTMLGGAVANGAKIIFTGMGGDELCSYQAGELPRSAGPESGAASSLPFATRRLNEAFAERDAFIDDAPQALMYTSALESAAAASTLYLNAGIWPISPLCTPELVEFCRRLPFEWRHRRAISRKALASFKCTELITDPKPNTLENFCGVMNFALQEASADVIAKLFRESRLADQGLIDGDALVKTYAQYRRGDSRHGDQILGAVVLELTIRALE